MTEDDDKRKLLRLRELAREMGLRGVSITFRKPSKNKVRKSNYEEISEEIKRLLEKNGDAQMLGSSREKTYVFRRAALQSVISRISSRVGLERLSMDLAPLVLGRGRTVVYHYEKLIATQGGYDPDFIKTKEYVEQKYYEDIEKIIEKHFAN